MQRANNDMMCLQGPSLQVIRRHSRSSEQMHYGPALHTVTGNYVAGKRKGVVGGVDFGSTGLVSQYYNCDLASLSHSCTRPMCV